MTASKPEVLFEARRQCHPLHNPHKDPVKQHTEETTHGIADYGNAMGIPHGDGSIRYDPRFAGNNLVNVAALSVAERSRLVHNKVPTVDHPSKFVGIYIGKASDTTGVGGTKFASVAIDMTKTDLNEKAVQDPDPHLQEAVVRGLQKVVDKAIAEGWKHKLSLKDMGAAGLLCSTIEQLHGNIGVVINGDLVPKNAPRSSLELLEAETQERFFIYVHEDHAADVLHIFNEEVGLPHINKGAKAAIVGRCNDTGMYVFVNNGVIDVAMSHEDLAKGPLLYRQIRERVWTPQAFDDEGTPLTEKISRVLGSINFKSDRFVHDHYDKHVRSTNVVTRGQGAATLRTHPLVDNKVGFSMIFDSNCVYGIMSPQFQAEDSFLRAAYKLAAVGCSVIDVTNNANYGRMAVPEEMWEFVEGQKGVARACHNWEIEPDYWEMIQQDPETAEKMAKDARRHVTVNGGNCSVNKANANTKTAIPPTTILGVVGWTPAPDGYATWDLKTEESTLYLVGARQEALGGSDYLQTVFGPNMLGDKLFEVDYATARKEVSSIIRAVRSGMVSAANAIEEGGLCNAVAEMVANTNAPVDVEVDLTSDMGGEDLTYTHKLFSESYGMVLQVPKEREEAFLEIMKESGVATYAIGSSQAGEGRLSFRTHTRLRIGQTHIQQAYTDKLERSLNGMPLTTPVEVAI